jgi:hypothetical protein
MAKAFSRLFWTVVVALMLALLAGVITGYGGGDARGFYGLSLVILVWVVGAGFGAYVLFGQGEDAGIAIGFLVTLICGVISLPLWHSVVASVPAEHTGALLRGDAVEQIVEPNTWVFKNPYLTLRTQQTVQKQEQSTFVCYTSEGKKRLVTVKYSASLDKKDLAEFFKRNPEGTKLNLLLSKHIQDAVCSQIPKYKDEELDGKRGEIEQSGRTRLLKAIEADKLQIDTFGVAFFSAE